ncbi:MAG: hypothetical protein M0P43_08245 [Arcobacteraceae bacterium]|nr:hypothetical protein [Arcobacteraceae bacterium]
MKTIIALNSLITEHEALVKMFKRQIQEHESGVNRLSRVIKASTETNLIDSSEKLEQYRIMIKDAMTYIPQNKEYLEELEHAIKRQQSFNLKKLRLKKFDEIQIPSDKRLEAMKIFDEFDLSEVVSENEAFDIYIKTHNISEEDIEEIKSKFFEIHSEFKSSLKNIKEEDIADMGALNYKIVFLVLDLYRLVTKIKDMMTPKVERISIPTHSEEQSNIQETPIEITPKKEEQPQTTFKGFPKYDDWWIDELWKNPEAYLALYKWKLIVSHSCLTLEQKNKWRDVFQNWMFIKVLLNTKKDRAFAYMYAFDSLIRKYGDMEEELEDINIEALENIIHKIIFKENMVGVQKDHNLVTSYLRFKKGKLENK